jgi:acylphosphatase
LFKKGKKLIVALLVLVAALAFWPEETAPDLVTAADMHVFVEKLFKKKHVTGSVAIVQNGHVQVVNYGLANAKQKVKNGASQVVYPGRFHAKGSYRGHDHAADGRKEGELKCF